MLELLAFSFSVTNLGQKTISIAYHILCYIIIKCKIVIDSDFNRNMREFTHLYKSTLYAEYDMRCGLKT